MTVPRIPPESPESQPRTRRTGSFGLDAELAIVRGQATPDSATTSQPQPRRTGSFGLESELDEVRRARALQAQTNVVRDQDPERWAKARDLGTRLGLPTDVVVRNLETIEAEIQSPDFDPKRFTQDSPVTADWLMSEENAALARDEYASLGRLERLFGRWERIPGVSIPLSGPIPVRLPLMAPTTKGLAQRVYEQESVVTELGRIGVIPPSQRTAAMRALQAELEAKRMQYVPEAENALERLVMGSARILPSMVETVEAGGVGAAYGGIAGAVIGSFGGGVGAAPGFVFGAKVGGGLNAFFASATMEGGNAVLEYERTQDADGNYVDPSLAYAEGMSYGVVAGLFEMLGLKFVGGTLAKPIMNRLMRNATHAALRKPTTAAALANGVKAWATAVGGETATEMAQTGLQLAVEQEMRWLSNLVDDTDFESVGWDRAAYEIAETGIETAVGMVLLGIPGGSVTTVSDLAHVAEARSNRALIEQLGNSAHALKLRERAPAALRELIAKDIEAHGPITTVSIPAERLNVLLQESDISPDQFFELFEDPDVVRESAPGGDIVIPLPEYAVTIAPTEFGRKLMDDVRLRPGALTAREAREMEATIQKDAAALRSEMQEIAEAFPEDESSQRVYNAIVDQLTAIGHEKYTPAVIEETAKIQASMYVAFAKKWREHLVSQGQDVEGVTEADPWQLYASRNLQIIGGSRAEFTLQTARAVQRAEARGATATEIATLRSRLSRLADDRIAVRTVLEESEQVQDVRDEEGRLRRSFRRVGTESLVLEYIQLRDQVLEAQALVGSIEDHPSFLAAHELASVGAIEDVNARVEEWFGTLVRDLGDEADNWTNLSRMLRQSKTLVSRHSKAVERMQRELEARGITDADTYREQHDLFGDIGFDPAVLDDVPWLEQAGQIGPEIAARLRSLTQSLVSRGRYTVAALSELSEAVAAVPADIAQSLTVPGQRSSLSYSAAELAAREQQQRTEATLSRVEETLRVREEAEASRAAQGIVGDPLAFSRDQAGVRMTEDTPARQRDAIVKDLELVRRVASEEPDDPRLQARLAEVERQLADFDAAHVDAAGTVLSGRAGLAQVFDRLQREVIPGAEVVSLGEQYAGEIAEAREIKSAAGGLPNVADADVQFVRHAEALEMAVRQVQPRTEVLEQSAFHGSPYFFGKFSLDFVGTGEGAQAYGWGLYFAESQKVGSLYRDRLGRPGRWGEYRNPAVGSDAYRLAELFGGDGQQFETSDGRSIFDLVKEMGGRRKDDSRSEQIYEFPDGTFWINSGDAWDVSAGGSLYQVEIPDSAIDQMLNWEQPLSEHSPEVREAFWSVISNLARSRDIPAANALLADRTRDSLLGREAYDRLASWFEDSGQRAASQVLAAAGIPGVKYFDAASRARGEGTRNFVLFDDALVTITSVDGENVSFQERTEILSQAQQRGPRRTRAGATNAFYIPLPTQRIIGLLATANESSFVHEAAHEYLRMLVEYGTRPDAPQTLQSDLTALLREFKVENVNQIEAKHEERFARGFESYLAAGKAPTRDLTRAFTRFRIWMTRIYRTAKEMLLPVSPELTGVFDRMLATEEQIALAQEEAATEPMFETSEEYGGTGAEFDRYRVAAEYRASATSTRLVKTLLEETDKWRREEWQHREAEVRDLVTMEVNSEPVHVAVRYLRTGEMPDGYGDAALSAPALEEPVQLSVAALEELYGKGIVASLPSGLVSKTSGVDPDTLAPLFGFRTGDQMVTALQSYIPADRVIAQRVAETMRREFPDMLHDSPVLASEAQRTSHLADTDDVLVDELKALGRSAANVPATNIKAVKVVAREIIGETTLRDMQPDRFLRAEQKAGRLSTQALKRGDRPAAAFYKRQQLMNHVLYREARKALERQDAALKFFTRMAKLPAQQKMGLAGQKHRDAMNVLLDRYEFRRVSGTALDRRDSLLDYIDWVAEEGLVVPRIPDEVIEDARQVNYRSLKSSELDAVYESGRQIYEIASRWDKVLRDKEKRSLAEVAQAVAATIAEHHELKPRPVDYAPISLDKLKQKLAAVDAWHLAPEFLFRWLDGDSYGVVSNALFQPFADAQGARDLKMKAALKEIDRLESMVDLPGMLSGSVHVPGIRAKLTKREMLAIALNWGSESNREALLAAQVDGGMQLGNATAIERVLSMLTAKELEYVQAKWDYIDTFWAEIKALEEAMTGVAPEKIEAAPFTVVSSDGQTVQMKGGYYPLKYDRKLGFASKTRQLWETGADPLGAIASVGPARQATVHGWTKERQGSNHNPVSLSLSVFDDHVINVIHDLTHRRAVRDVARLLRRPEVRKAIVETAGQNAYDSLKPWLSRIATPDQTFDNSFVASILARARAGTTIVTMGLKVTTGVQQILGVTNSIDYIGPVWFAKGAAAFAKNPLGAWKQVQEMSAEMEFRPKNYQRDIRDLVAGKRGRLNKRDSFVMYMIGAMDMVVSVPTWLGAYRQSMESLTVGDHTAAVAYADHVVRQTQGASAPKDLSRIQGGPELHRQLTMYYTYFSRLYGMLRRAGANIAEGRWGLPRLVTSLTLIWFMDALLSDALTGRWPDSDDDENVFEWALWTLVRHPMNTVVGLRSLAPAVGPDGMDFRLTPTEDAFKKSARAVNAMYKVTAGEFFSDEDEELTESELRAMFDAIGYWGRLPTAQTWITGKAIMDWMQGEDEPESLPGVFPYLFYNRRR